MDELDYSRIKEWATDVVQDGRRHPDVQGYLRDEDGHPDWRYAAVEALYDEAMVAYDDQYGTDQPDREMEIRTPAYAALHDALCDLWVEVHGHEPW